MAHERMTLLDIAKKNNSDAVVGLIDEASVAHPEWRIGFARTINGTQYKTLVRTALPDVGFRKANEGIETKKSTLVNRLVECFIVDGSWDMDKAVADADEDGPESACALEASGHLEAAITAVCKQLYYGTASGVTGAADGFQGLQSLCDASMLVNANGTGDASSSVYAVKWGIKAVGFVFGRQGKFAEGDILTQQITKDSKQMWAYVQELQGWIGLQVASKYSFGRIKNITTAAPLTDDLLGDLYAKFPVGQKPDVFLMSRNSQRLLQNSRTATNPSGDPAPFPNDAFGVPIEPTDSIVDTETAA